MDLWCPHGRPARIALLLRPPPAAPTEQLKFSVLDFQEFLVWFCYYWLGACRFCPGVVTGAPKPRGSGTQKRTAALSNGSGPSCTALCGQKGLRSSLSSNNTQPKMYTKIIYFADFYRKVQFLPQHISAFLESKAQHYSKERPTRA